MSNSQLARFGKFVRKLSFLSSTAVFALAVMLPNVATAQDGRQVVKVSKNKVVPKRVASILNPAMD